SSSLLSSATGISTTNTLTLNDGSSTTAVISGSTLAVTAGTTVQDLLDTIEGVAGVRAEFDEGTGEVTVYSNDSIALQNDVSTTAELVAVTAAAFTTTSDTLIDSGSFDTGDTLTLTDGNGYELGSFEIEEDSSVNDLVNFINDFQGVSAEFNTATGKIALESETDLALTSDNSNFNADSYTADSDGVNISALSDSGFATDSSIERTVDRLNTALSTLRTQASEFGTNLSIVENRQDFTKSMINTLEEGAGKLTLADTNEEGANLLALQTRQSLASTSLSFAAQADQNVLRLF
ncbi:flagellin, partial [Labrenzia sp. OB1]|uniref:flagellin n=1 Tax=Labrenzia sp. OB1 TaxID=1561204 RepID=UPI0007B2DE02